MDSETLSDRPIGVYDSGVGGLSVLRALRALLPHEHFIYVADQAKVPYGNRSLAELRQLAEGVTQFLLSHEAKLVVIACNTASAAALKTQRMVHPGLPFVGMEPAVKPAAEQTASHKVGVLATPSTFQGELYASVVERFAADVEIFKATCPGLVSQIEKGYLATPKTNRILAEALLPMLAQGVDTLVMGCTHFPFVIPEIEKITRGCVRVIDPAPAVARQTGRVLAQKGLLAVRQAEGWVDFYTTGNPARFSLMIGKLIGLNTGTQGLRWEGQSLNEVSKS